MIGFFLVVVSPLNTRQPTLGCDVPVYPTTVPSTYILQAMLLNVLTPKLNPKSYDHPPMLF